MPAGDQRYQADADDAEARRAPPPAAEGRLTASPGRQAGRRARRDWAALAWAGLAWAGLAWTGLAWAVGGAVLFGLLLRISLTTALSSDVANNALQAGDMLHGNVLLHGWILGDATYDTFELPLFMLVEIFFGLHTIAGHIALALIYAIVAACAVAIAVTGSSGFSRAARAGVVVAMLAAPLLIYSDMWIPIGLPDHTGTTVFLLVCCLLVDRVPDRPWTPPLLCLILCAGQLGDVSVRYVAVPAIALVCAYRVIAGRKTLTGDTANLVAALVSVPLAVVVRADMRHFGAYLMVAPKTTIAPAGEWPHNGALTWHALRMLFGETAAVGAPPAGLAAVFGAGCLLAAAAGISLVLWHWRSARRAEQVLVVAIIANLVTYAISTLPAVRTPHDIVAVLPCGAVLAARALVPARIAVRRAGLAAASAGLAAALVPLSLVAAGPVASSPWSQMAAWLHAHRLSYGLGGYWDASAVTLLSGDQVQIRTVMATGRELTLKPWETDTSWFDAALHYADFVVIDLGGTDKEPSLAEAEQVFGEPATTHRVADWDILIYGKNLLDDVKAAKLPPVS